MALGEFIEELEKFNRDVILLTAQRNERRTEGAKEAEENVGGVRDLREIKQQIIAESEDLKLYEDWKLRTIVNSKFHIVARLVLIGLDSLIERYRLLLVEAKKLSGVTPQQGFIKHIAGWFSSSRSVEDVRADMDDLKQRAQLEIDLWLKQYSQK